MSTDLATLQPAEAGLPLTAAQLKSRLAVIQSVMRDVMKVDVDYGVIPGTQKPTLYKPGAEKLCVTFRLAPDTPVIESVPDYAGDIRYRVQVPIRASDGSIVAVGVGECSTGEEKYRWRRPVHEKEYQSAAEDQRREKWQRNGDVWQQVRVTPADVANTVLKMAHKRAYVHATIMATAAGAIFTQDIEDLPEGVQPNGPESRKPAPAQPQRRQEAAKPPAGAGTTVTIQVRDVTKKEGSGWIKYTVIAVDGQKYGTFDTKHADIARNAMVHEAQLSVTYIEGKYGRDIQAISDVADREPGAEG